MKKSADKKGKKVSFRVAAEPGSEVFVAGTFNNWAPRRHRMPDKPGSGVYQAELVLRPGRHEYKFVVNGEWRADPDCPEWTPNAHGSLNSVITV